MPRRAAMAALMLALAVPLALPLTVLRVQTALAARSSMAGRGWAERLPGRLGKPERIALTSAGDLVGRPLRDRDGAAAGEIAYVMIDARSGDMRYAVVAPDGEPTGEPGAGEGPLVAVPWPVLDLRLDGGAVGLGIGRAVLRRAPGVSRDRLADLTRPAMMARVYDHYGIPPEQRRREPGRFGEEGAPTVLIGRQVVTTLAPPALTSPGSLEGTAVVSANGEAVGSIERFMIDVERGHVAYVLVGWGGFLGLGGSWLPVPFPALRWQPGRAFYTLNLDTVRLAAVPKFAKEEVPAVVDADDLRDLYRHFRVSPYGRRG